MLYEGISNPLKGVFPNAIPLVENPKLKIHSVRLFTLTVRRNYEIIRLAYWERLFR